MSRFRKLSQTIWNCQYHIIWVPKYRLRILTGNVAEGGAKKAYRCYMQGAQARRSELIGGGLIRSQGNWSHVKALQRLGIREVSTVFD